MLNIETLAQEYLLKKNPRNPSWVPGQPEPHDLKQTSMQNKPSISGSTFIKIFLVTVVLIQFIIYLIIVTSVSVRVSTAVIQTTTTNNLGTKTFIAAYN